jgi:hypothetical protein
MTDNTYVEDDGLTRCGECSSADLAWSLVTLNVSGIGDGLLRLHDVQAALMLSCNECSATVRIIQNDNEVAALINGENAPAKQGES